MIFVITYSFRETLATTDQGRSPLDTELTTHVSRRSRGRGQVMFKGERIHAAS